MVTDGMGGRGCGPLSVTSGRLTLTVGSRLRLRTGSINCGGTMGKLLG